MRHVADLVLLRQLGGPAGGERDVLRGGRLPLFEGARHELLHRPRRPQLGIDITGGLWRPTPRRRALTGRSAGMAAVEDHGDVGTNARHGRQQDGQLLVSKGSA